MAKITDLPDELLVNIFKCKDAMDIACLQSICRHWWRLINDTPVLWQHALFLEYRTKHNTAARLQNRLFRIAVRSRGRISSLGLLIDRETRSVSGHDGSEFDIAATRSIFATLSDLDIRSLCIIVRNFSNSATIKELHKQIRNLYCPSLKHWTVEFENVVIANQHRVNVGEGAPILKGISTLCLRKGGWPLNFSEPKLSFIFQNLEVLRVDDVRFSSTVEVWTLYECLRHASLLRELYLDLGDIALPAKSSVGLEDESQIVDIHLGRLKRFYLRYTTGKGQSVDKQLFQFVCPELTTGLSLNCDSPYVFYASVLTSRIETIRLTSTMLEKAQHKEALATCTGLRRVYVDCEELEGDSDKKLRDTDEIVAGIEWLLGMPLDDLIIYGPESTIMQSLRSIVSRKIYDSVDSVEASCVMFGYKDTQTTRFVHTQCRQSVKRIVYKKVIRIKANNEPTLHDWLEPCYEIDDFGSYDDKRDFRLDM